MFEDRQIRTAWNAEQEEWYFSVTDVIAVLTDSADPKQYIKKMRSRDSELDARWGTICTLTSMVASDGKKYRTNGLRKSAASVSRKPLTRRRPLTALLLHI